MMADTSIYDTIAKRCGGDIYIGVVGPVRTGKSTFIRKFLDACVIPNIEDEFDRQRTLDEAPQSGSGRTVTTTEPKFVPGEAVTVSLDNTKLSVKMIDCVGYMVEGALGADEDGEERKVMTPWSEEAVSFSEAAEIGTEKVAREHSTIAMLVTTDGSIADIPRESYVRAEERVAKELTDAKKPFAIILNSKNPESESARELAESLEEKYSAPVALINCMELDEGDAKEIIRLVVGEFPVRELTFKLPEWTSAIGNHPIKGEILDKIKSFCRGIRKLSDLEGECPEDFIKGEMQASSGSCDFEIPIGRDKYFEVLSQLVGLDIDGDKALFSTVAELCEAKREYDKIKEALAEVRECGYGIVMPKEGELTLAEPTLVKQGGGYGVKVCAEAETIHLIRAGIRSEVCPALGTEEQAGEVVKQMREEYATDPKNLLETKIFGRSLCDLVSDDMNAKLHHLPPESREKLGHTLEKIINEGARGLVCILV